MFGAESALRRGAAALTSTLPILCAACVLSICPPARAEAESQPAKLSLAATRDGRVSSATYQVFVAGTSRKIAQGQIIGNLQGHRRVIDVPPDEYEVELESLDVINSAPVRLGPVRVEAGAVAELSHEFASGALSIFVVRAGAGVTADVEIYDDAAKLVARGPTRDDPSRDPAAWVLIPGRYRVVTREKEADERSVQLEIVKGSTTEHLVPQDQNFSILIEGGELIVVRGSGIRSVLATAGPFRSPAVAPNGKLIAFVRSTPHKRVSDGFGNEGASELWISGLEPGSAKRLLEGRASQDASEVIAEMRQIQFSPDSRRVFFSTAAWVVSDAVHSVDVATGAERFVTAGNAYRVLHDGPYAGQLLVRKHKYYSHGHGSYDAECIVTFDGEEIEQLGALP